MIIFADGQTHDMLLELARRGIGALDFQFPKTAAVLRNNKLAAIAVYHNFAPPDIQMSFYALTPRWAHVSTIRDLLAYPFIQLRVRRVTALIKKSNKRSRRMVEGLGWKLEGTIRRGARDGQNLMLYGMLAEEFGERYGQVRTTFTSAVRPAAAGGGEVRAGTAAGVALVCGRQGPLGAETASGPRESHRSASGFRSGATPVASRRISATPEHAASAGS